MKFKLKKWKHDESDKKLWFTSSRVSSMMSFESITEKKKWNFSFLKKQKTNNITSKQIESQSTIILEDEGTTLQNYIEPVEIQKTLKSTPELLENLSQITIKQSELNLLESPCEIPLGRNLFTPKFKGIRYFHSRQSGKISPEYLIRENHNSRRPWSPTDLDSGIWNSLSLQIPPSPVLLPETIQSQNQIYIKPQVSNRSIKQTVNSIFQKLLSDPSIKSRISKKPSIQSLDKPRIPLNNIKHLPNNLNEPLTESSNIEVFEQEMISRIRRRNTRAWTSEPKESKSTSEWSIFSWMGAPSLTLNALALPTLVIPFTHFRDLSLDHHIELSSLGSDC